MDKKPEESPIESKAPVANVKPDSSTEIVIATEPVASSLVSTSTTSSGAAVATSTTTVVSVRAVSSSKPTVTTVATQTTTPTITTPTTSQGSSVTISLGVGALQSSPSPKGAPAALSTVVGKGTVEALVNPLLQKPSIPKEAEATRAEVKITEAVTTSVVNSAVSTSTTLAPTATSTASSGATTTVPPPPVGMKRPAETTSAPVASEPSAGESSEGDPKKKKMRKDNTKDGRSESPSSTNGSRGIKSAKYSKGISSTTTTTTELTEKDKNVGPGVGSCKEKSSDVGVAEAVVSSKPAESIEDTDTNKKATAMSPVSSGGETACGMKVPPLKIVLQTLVKEDEVAAPPPVTTVAASTNPSFPYIVSSTTGGENVGKISPKTSDEIKEGKPALPSPTTTANSSEGNTEVIKEPAVVTTAGVTASISIVPTTSTTTAMPSAAPSEIKDVKGRKDTISPPTVIESYSKGKEKDKHIEEGGKEKESYTHHGKKEKQPAEEKVEKESKDKEGVQQVGSSKEKPTRITRSSHRILEKHGASHTPNSPSSISPKTSACPSPAASPHGDDKHEMEKMDTLEPPVAVDLHPRKRKLKPKEPAGASSTNTVTTVAVIEKDKDKEKDASESSGAGTSTGTSAVASAAAQSELAPMMNCFEMWFNIRKQIARRRRNLFPVTPKPPKGFKDYLMNRGTYVLQGSPTAQMAVPLLTPLSSLNPQMKESFIEQEKSRHKLRLQHLVEKEKLVLAVEQEILRVHGRAARALSNQALPFSVCTILKDEEVYSLLTPEQEEKDITARSRYNGRLFLSWLQDVDDKWDKIKEQMLLRHHNEAESLNAVQKMDWEWKLKELGLCEPKATPLIEEHQVPMVHVSDDFDLLPA